MYFIGILLLCWFSERLLFGRANTRLSCGRACSSCPPNGSRVERIFNSFAKPKQQQLATPRGWQERAIRRNGEFMRTHFKPSEHLAVGGINLDHVEFGVQRHSLWMRADVQVACLAEGHVVKLTSVLPLTEKLPLWVKPLEAAVLTVGNINISLRTNSY